MDCGVGELDRVRLFSKENTEKFEKENNMMPDTGFIWSYLL